MQKELESLLDSVTAWHVEHNAWLKWLRDCQLYMVRGVLSTTHPQRT
jgi:hypothetical protein